MKSKIRLIINELVYNLVDDHMPFIVPFWSDKVGDVHRQSEGIVRLTREQASDREDQTLAANLSHPSRSPIALGKQLEFTLHETVSKPLTPYSRVLQSIGFNSRSRS